MGYNNNQERIADYIYTVSGGKFSPINPKIEDIVIEDVAHSLSRLVRFGGAIEKPYTVGEHSLRCYEVAKRLDLDKDLQLYALFHDGAEGLGFSDLCRGLKQNLSDYKDLEDKAMLVIWEKLGVSPPNDEQNYVIKKIDNTLLINEIEQLTNRKIEDYPNVDHYNIFVDVSQAVSMDEIRDKFLEAYNKIIN